MTTRKHLDEEAIAAIATRIYCTRLSLGDHMIDLTCIAEDALAIYQACAAACDRCVEQAARAK